MNAAMRKATPVRRSATAMVHIAKKALKLDDETYRSILEKHFNVSSSADLNDAQLGQLVEHFKSLGFKPKRKAPARAGTRPMGDAPEHRKMRALWLSLYHLGVVSEPSEAALAHFAKRVSGGQAGGTDALQWLSGDACYKIIEALKKWATREGGVHWVAYKDRAGNLIGYNDRARVIEAQWRILQKLQVRFTFVAVLALSEREGDDIIAAQGAEIRRAKTVLL